LHCPHNFFTAETRSAPRKPTSSRLKSQRRDWVQYSGAARGIHAKKNTKIGKRLAKKTRVLLKGGKKVTKKHKRNFKRV